MSLLPLRCVLLAIALLLEARSGLAFVRRPGAGRLAGLGVSRMAKEDKKQSTVDYGAFGKLEKVAKILDSATGDFALSYADTRPYKANDPVGFTFLASNVVFFVAGTDLVFSGAALSGSPNIYSITGLLVDVAGVFSVKYHYDQLTEPFPSMRVRLSLLADYITAILAIGGTVGTFLQYYSSSHEAPSLYLTLAFMGVLSLLLSWRYEAGLTYIFFHGLWHILSGLATMEMSHLVKM